MRYIFIIAFLFCSYIAIGQNVPAPTFPAHVAPVLAPSVAPVVTPVVPAKTESAPTTPAPPTAVSTETVPQAAATSTQTVTTASSETNVPPPPAPVKDPAKCVIARLSFDNNFQPDVGGSTIPVTFTRLSTSYLEGIPIDDNMPRFVEGRFGKAVLIEAAYANFFSIAQATAGETSAFKPVQGTELSISTDPGFAKGYAEASQPWQGKEMLAVATKGENSEEGFSAEAQVERAFYTKEHSAIVPAGYLASLYLKGQGNIKLVLKDIESGASSEPVYVDLPAHWQRFCCLFTYHFGRINIGPNHETDWRNSLPPGTNITSHLQLVCTTVDSQKLIFFADGLQLEQRNTALTKTPGMSPHSWVPGAFQTKQEQLAIDVRNDYFNTWKKTGSIAFWFKPLWEARDSSKEIIMQIAKNQLLFSHDNQKILFSPAGVSFTPYEWKNNWHHIVVTWNEAGERALYVDGMDYPNAAGEAKPLKDQESIMAGDFTKNLSPNGALDELILYNIPLNPEQAKALAAAEPATTSVESKTADQPPAPAATVSTEQKTDAKPSSDSAKQKEEEKDK